jgi:hypothetical protein
VNHGGVDLGPARVKHRNDGQHPVGWRGVAWEVAPTRYGVTGTERMRKRLLVLDSVSRPGPEGGGVSTSQGRPYGIFQRAIQRRNVLAAVAAAKELPQLGLDDALELTMLVARKDPHRHERMAARWLLRLLEEDPALTIQEAALAASSLAALPGAGYLEAAQTLKAMAERASSRRRTRGVA